jgi:adenylate cyclase
MSAPLETQIPPLAANCLVCGIPLVGLGAVFLRWRGIRRSPRNPSCCTQCGAHLEEGRLVEMTVVFADLSSFTEMTGRLGATTTYSVVDEFLRLASTTLMSHGAFIDKYIGDAVMALFNVPIKRADHAAAAVAAAAKLQEVLPGLSQRLGMPLHASIGIASGFARVGRLGSDDIKDYTAIGDVVNQAARLQAQAHRNTRVTGCLSRGSLSLSRRLSRDARPQGLPATHRGLSVERQAAVCALGCLVDT